MSQAGDRNHGCDKESPGIPIPSKDCYRGQKSGLPSTNPDSEASHQRFRQFCPQEVAGPHEAFSKLWELCCQWLRPKTHSKEQMLELLDLEQFPTILPEEIQTWVRKLWLRMYRAHLASR